MSLRSSADPAAHSDPIPIGTANRTRPRSASDASSDDSVPPLSPSSQSPSSAPSINIPTPSRITVPVSPSTSPILSYFLSSPNKTGFNRAATSTSVFDDEESREPPPTPASAHGRRMSSSWIPVRFGPQQQVPPATESQQDRGAGVLRRLSLSGTLTNKNPASGQGRSTTPPSQDGGTPRPGTKPGPRGFKQHRKAATLSAGTVDANKPRAPSPMGERMLKGHYDGF